MSLLTNWGYELTEAEQLPDMLSISDFNMFTANRYAGDVRTAGNISAACSAIRNYVGWHLYPSAACKVKLLMNDRRVTVVGPDLLVQLPAKFVTGVTAVTINGVAHTDYSFETNGIMRIYNVSPVGIKRYTPVEITYTAGLSDEMLGGIKELIAHMATHAAASSNGVTSEAVGGVSVTYNAGWVNSARATALQDDNKEVLAPYRLQGVF